MKPRDPADVCKRLLDVVPLEERELRARLNQLADDSFFQPPEGKWIVWQKLRDALEDRFPEGPVPGTWGMVVSGIVRGIE